MHHIFIVCVFFLFIRNIKDIIYGAIFARESEYWILFIQ